MTTEGTAFAHLRPVLLVACASIAFSVNDVCLKLLSGSYPLHEIMVVRTVVAVAILVTVILRRRDPTLFTAHRPAFLIARSLLLFLSNAALYSSFAVLPLADAVAVFFSAPLIITILSACFLGEKVGPWRFSAILAGIAGVVLIVRPSGGTLGLVSVLPILSAFFYASAQVLTRRIGLRERALTTALFGQSGFLGFSTVFALVFGRGAFSGTGNRDHHPSGAEAAHALTIKLDPSVKAAQRRCAISWRGANARSWQGRRRDRTWRNIWAPTV